MTYAPHSNGARFKIHAAAKALNDLPHGHEPRAGGHAEPLIFAACMLLCLMAFFGWLLVG